VGDSPSLIAVIDDYEPGCDAVSSLVRSAGYRCVTFRSAEAFLKDGREKDPGCILLDIRIPGMDGFDLHRALIRMNWEIPIIYVTASSETHYREQAFRLGAAAFLPKPFHDEDLLNAIRNVLNGFDQTSGQ
jgi:FixJ family two-component response regulator